MPLVAVTLFLAAVTQLTARDTGAGTNAVPAATFNYDYATPALLTGTIYATGPDHKQVLFTFRRTATRSGETVRVERQYLLPDGSTAASENIVYESGRLVSYEMKDLQAGVWGDIQIQPDPKIRAHDKICIRHGHDGDPKIACPGVELPKDTLIDDSIYPFMLAHWDELMRGTAAKFRFVSLEWETTFAFKLTKTGETRLDGVPVVILRMEPSNPVLGKFINPIIFNVQKDSPHRVIEYLGRTTPRIKSGKTWKPLDADTVFDWK